ncbi:GNAT family N-acetyltransferase [Sphingomicrobium arenosum]|uniref:GNAT family N-acetyltransferase n=1 Tax=Sphingomicrobium arenosum TaxID=2233861 RepID=UPI00223ED825|nr:GNAT family N-acetyltransferase [Sphingomicrobium arenosum]
MSLHVSPMRRGEEGAVLALMRGLAAFEHYLDDFAVTAADLERFGHGKARRFTAHVARLDSVPVGVAVTHRIDWTFDLRPVRVLKEMFVAPEARGSGAGAALFAAVRAEAVGEGAGRVRWLVLADNDPAKAFYASQGGRHLAQWETWELAL